MDLATLPLCSLFLTIYFTHIHALMAEKFVSYVCLYCFFLPTQEMFDSSDLCMKQKSTITCFPVHCAPWIICLTNITHSIFHLKEIEVKVQLATEDPQQVDTESYTAHWDGGVWQPTSPQGKKLHGDRTFCIHSLLSKIFSHLQSLFLFQPV